ncbi:MAG: hypothetical protein E7425_04610 [Ruminococcaceae bacterium]|nr:hypothetical protein [Oscillospiraceae bacterium]
MVVINPFIQTQINNMLFMLTNFENSCEYAALQDDKQISASEQATLKKIKKAVAHFRKDLESVS